VTTASDIRSGFLKFFEDRGHRIVRSAPVIPYDDSTLLFTNAGMNQFKDVFLGTGRREYARAADSQKCIRVSGKHNDLEEVGRDTYHHTFFEMLGNWSFGDYYKAEAIRWAWELLTRVWGIPAARLYASVYETDDEAEACWKSMTGIHETHVLRFGKKDNFWEMGETGPCGPCSEIHIDLTRDSSGRALVNAGDPRVMEIWNLVFIQYDRDERGNLTPLPAKHVDTGMGFERITAVLQGKRSNYDTDIFLPIIGHISEIVRRPYSGKFISAQELHAETTSAALPGEQKQFETDIALRVLADHTRMLAFAIADGGIPSNEGRGYVMRRILRRAARFGRTLEIHEPFLHRIVEAVAGTMGDEYPEIRERREHIERVIKGEEESFGAALDRGLEIFDAALQEVGHSKTFPGEDAFKLYDTYGFPLDLTEMMAAERGLTVDTARFVELMNEQRDRARSARGVEGFQGPEDEFQAEKPSRFTGYEEDESRSVITDARPQPSGMLQVVMEASPFYTESGGQVSDAGELEFVDLGRRARVEKVLKSSGGAIVHLVKDPGGVAPGMQVRALIDRVRRRNTERNHTATHLVHEALRRVLGSHLHQQGSLVAPDRLRFDFNHFEKISQDQLRAIEDIVNEKIAQDIRVQASNNPDDWLTIEEAKSRYPTVKMFFGDRYGDRVRVVEVDPAFSVELCGGTHVDRTKSLGLFKIVAESGIASGIRRIEAVTGDGLDAYIRERAGYAAELQKERERLHREQEELRRQLGLPPQEGDLLEEKPTSGRITLEGTPERARLEEIEKSVGARRRRIEELTHAVHDLKKQISRHRVEQASSGIKGIAAGARTVDGVRVAFAVVEAGTMDELKSLGDALRVKLSSGVGVLGAAIDGKAALVCVVTDDLITTKKLSAGSIVGEIARRVGGGGGGKPHLATAGGKDPARLNEAISETPAIIQRMLTKKG
jgi:alanyl-tRNA synthetase